MPRRISQSTKPATTITDSDVTVRHSEIADFRQCPTKWWLKWVQKWNPTETSEASTLGTAWHHLMGVHYGEIRRLQLQGLQASTDDCWVTVEPGLDYYAGADFEDRLRWMYSGHLEQYGTDDEWEVLDFESTKTVEILPGIQYEWTTDLLVLDHSLGRVRVVDHKSTKNPLRKIDTDLSDQLGLYINAEIRSGRDVVDGITNQARTEKLKRTMTPDERFARIPTYRPPVELDNIWYDAQRTIQHMLQFRDEGEMPYSSPDPRVCSWKCDFVEAHLILRKTPRSKWDSRLGPLMRTKGLVQKEVPRGSDPLPQ